MSRIKVSYLPHTKSKSIIQAINSINTQNKKRQILGMSDIQALPVIYYDIRIGEESSDIGVMLFSNNFMEVHLLPNVNYILLGKEKPIRIYAEYGTKYRIVGCVGGSVFDWYKTIKTTPMNSFLFEGYIEVIVDSHMDMIAKLEMSFGTLVLDRKAKFKIINSIIDNMGVNDPYTNVLSIKEYIINDIDLLYKYDAVISNNPLPPYYQENYANAMNKTFSNIKKQLKEIFKA